MALNLYKIHLDLISLAFQYDISVDVLHELRKTLQRIHDRTIDITKDLSQDNAEFIWRDTNSVIEDLHGAAFVISQSSITAIVSRLKAIHQFAQSAGTPIISIPREKKDMLTFKSAVISSTGTSQIQAIEAFANYFKHNDEWPSGWVNPDPRSKPTIDSLHALGFQFYNDSILRNAMQLFDSNRNLLALANSVSEWHEAILKELKTEFASSGVI
jgi:hypothetical protein